MFFTNFIFYLFINFLINHKIITFLPYSKIDWSATGSMIGGIGTWAACIAAAIVAIIVARKQSRQTELQIKIALYDKRYDIYQIFRNLYAIGGIYFVVPCDNDDKIVSYILEIVRADYIYNNENYGKKHIQKLAGISDSSNDSEIYRNAYKISVIKLIESTKFCFEKTFNAKNIEKYTRELFAMSESMNQGCNDEAVIHYKEAQTLWQTITEDKMKEKMENQLHLSYK